MDPGWHARPTPAIRAGEQLKKAVWNDPSVTKEGLQYVMYATTSTRELFKPPVLPFRFVSSTGTDWRLEPDTPLLDAGESGFASCETPSVVQYEGKYHMFYTGIYPVGTIPPMAVGHAISDDGKRWRPDPPGPVLKATGTLSDWNGYLVGEPGAVTYKGKIYLYFVSVGARKGGNPPQRQVIAVATTTDGKIFDTPREVAGQLEGLYPPARGYAGYSTPSATVRADKVYLFYDVCIGAPKWEQVALHHAVSDDGVTFRQARAPLLTRSSLSWTSGEIRSPTVLFEGGKARMWFGGHGDVRLVILSLMGGLASGEFGIGYAEAELSQVDAALEPEPLRKGVS